MDYYGKSVIIHQNTYQVKYMDIVFEALFFLGVGLLGITITIFVLSVSLLGRAIKIREKELGDAKEKRKKETEETIKDLHVKIDEYTNKDSLNYKKLEKDLKHKEKSQKQSNIISAWLKEKTTFMEINGGVYLPGGLLLVSMVSSMLGQQNFFEKLPYDEIGLGTVSVGMILLSLVCISQTLKVIQGIALTSDETSFTRDKEAFKAAQKELEEAKRPILDMSFKNISFPFHISANTEREIQLTLKLIKADIAEDVFVYFYIDQGFSFINEETAIEPPDFPYPSCRQFVWPIPKVLSGIMYYKYLKIKSPLVAKKYKLAYSIVCKGSLPSKTLELEIIVEKG
jgi:hypothetical protein